MTESENYSNEEQLLNLLEELQTENEALQEEILQLQSQETTLKKSSEMQELLLTIAEQKKRIAEQDQTISWQSELIGKQSESDLIFQENESLKLQNQWLSEEKANAQAEADRKVQNYKNELDQKAQELAYKECNLNQRSTAVWKKELDLDKNIRQCADSLVKDKLEKLDKKFKGKEKMLEAAYKAKTIGIQGLLFGCLLYGILCTFFAAGHSERFISDFKAFFVGIGILVPKLVKNALEGAKWLSQVGYQIEQETIARIVDTGILILVCLAIFGGVLALIGIAGYKLVKMYRKRFADNISLAVFLVCLAVIVYFAEPIRSAVPINLIVLLLLAHLVYIGIRAYVEACRRNRRY